MSKLVDDLKGVIRRELLARLGPAAKTDLAGLSLGELLVVYGNWRDRFPEQRPRVAHQSTVLRGRTEYATKLHALAAKIEAGDDLHPHLSKRVATAYEGPSRTKRLPERHDLDLLLADWGIHHLHLSGQIGTDGWAKRGRDLLFVIFRPDDAYLIDVMDHGSRTKLRLLEIAVREWPDAELFMSSLTAVGLSQKYHDAQRKQLREAGIAQPVEIDGTVYMPRGQSLGGTAIDVGMGANNVLWQLDAIGKDTRSWLRQRSDGRGGQFWRACARGDQCGFTKGRVFVSVIEFT